jgi:hypothetical protein
MKITKNFTKAPNALFMLYTRLPNFKADHAMMYTVLVHFYNDEHGYAYPTQQELALRLNCGINKPAQLIKVLEDYGLVTKVRNKQLGNYKYYLELPIDNEKEFYAKYPQALSYYGERVEALTERKEASEQAKATVLARQEQQPTDLDNIEW